MPKALHEIKTFAQGIMTNASERDIPEESPAFSLNVDPNAINGKLDGIKGDRLAASLGRHKNAVSDEPLGHLSGILTLRDINCFNDQYSQEITFIGTAGEKEVLEAFNIAPTMEQVVEGSLGLTFNPSASITDTTTSFEYLSKTNAIVETNLPDADFEATGFTNGSATIECKDSVITNYDTSNDNYFTIVTPDGKSVSYKFLDGSATSATGTAAGGYTIIGMSDVTASVTAIATNVKNAIENATNGHGTGRITITQASGVLTLSYAIDTFNQYIKENDYICLGEVQEYLKITSIDTSTRTVYFNRRAFGSRTKEIATGTNHNLYANRITIDSVQITTKKGTCSLKGWSLYDNNHIGGNSSYLISAAGDLQQAKTGRINTDATGDYDVVFSAADKTITFDANANPTYFKEGDIITIYSNKADTANHATSFKILSHVDNIMYLDTAPTDLSEPSTGSSDVVYMEANLLKNHTFHHALSGGGESIGPTRKWKVNNWISKSYDWKTTEQDNVYNRYFTTDDLDANVKSAAGAFIAQVTSGGYWDDTTAGHGADASATYYPFETGDRYVTIQSSYKTTAVKLGLAMAATDVTITAEMVTGSNASVNIAKDDILYIETDFTDNTCDYNDDPTVTCDASSTIMVNQFVSGTGIPAGAYIISVNTPGAVTSFELSASTTGGSVTNGTLTFGNREYMRVVSIDNLNITVQRGVFNSSIVAHTIGSPNFIFKNINNILSQEVDYTKLKAGQTYKLSFYGKYASGGSYPNISLSVGINGGHFNSNGGWKEYQNDSSNGYVFNQEDQKMQEHKWISHNSLYNPNNDFSQLDSTWRKFEYTFTIPKIKNLKSNLEIQFCSRGDADSIVGIDLANLCEITPITKTSNITIDSSAFIDTKGLKDLITFNKSEKIFEVIKGFGISLEIQESEEILNYSPWVSPNLSSSSMSMVPNNREVHVGMGSEATSNSPLWVGYLNQRVFGSDINELYIDEDTVHTYDEAGIYNFSKICTAGEHDYLDADYNGSNELVINHTDHSMNIGDNIVIRLWGDTSNSWSGKGVWYVSDTTANTIDCKRYTTVDTYPGNNESPKTDNDYRISYRPYFYYACRRGFNKLFRIWPDTRISADTTLDTYYYRGRVEESATLGDMNIISITTCYNKKADGTGGGCIYALAENNMIYKLDVQKKYDAWSSEFINTFNKFDIQNKSFKWSNEGLDGNKADGSEVFHSVAAESSPTIVPTGVLSDILETKGPIATYDQDFDVDNISDDGSIHTYTNNTPSNFDTRLWLQYHPGLENDGYFSADARFLFAAKTTDTNTTSNSTLYFADRTPPMSQGNVKKTSLSGGEVPMHSGRDNWIVASYRDPFFSMGSIYGIKEQDRAGATNYVNYARFAAINRTHQEPLIWNRHSGQNVAAKEELWPNDSEATGVLPLHSEVCNTSNYQMPMINWGDNIGWWGDMIYWPSTHNQGPRIAPMEYALSPLSDNDRDGLLDGTGMPTANNISLATGNPYGNWNQRVCSHGVSLIIKNMDADNTWVNSAGSTKQEDSNFFSGAAWNNDEFPLDFINGNPRNKYHQIGGEQFDDIDLFLMTATDIHFGDYTVGNRYEVDSIAAHDTNFTKLTIGEDISKRLQAGDQILIGAASSGSWTGVGKSTYISKIISTTEIQVPLAHDSTYVGHIYPHAMHMTTTNTLNGTTYEYWKDDYFSDYYDKIAATLPLNSQQYHWAFDSRDPNDGSIFTEGLQGYDLSFIPDGYTDFSEEDILDRREPSGLWGKTWYTAQNNRCGSEDPAYENDNLTPGIVNRVDRLNYRAGYTLRPIESDENDIALINKVSIDIPSYPDVIYHKQTGDPLSYTINSTDIHNRFASKLFISTSKTDNLEVSNIGIYDSNLLLAEPSDTIIPSDSYGAGPNVNKTDFQGLIPFGDMFAAGAIIAYVSSGSSTHPNAVNCPVLELDATPANMLITDSQNIFQANSRYRKTGALTGMMISVVDANYGTIETRYIVGSRPKAASTNVFVDVHYPFGHLPTSSDKWFLWMHRDACSSKIRLYKERLLNHGLGTAYKGSHILSDDDGTDLVPIYKNTGTIGTIDGDANSIDVTTSAQHGLSDNDFVTITGTTNYNVETKKITVKGPKDFEIASTSHDLASESAGTWTLANEETSASNPIRISSENANIMSTFGGLDMRKCVTRVTNSSADMAETGGTTTVTSDAHKLIVGDTVTLNDADAETVYEGTFPVVSVATNTFTVLNKTATLAADDNNVYNITTDQWENIVFSGTSSQKMGELRAGFTSWDKGLTQGNIIRSDNVTATFENINLAAFPDAIEITSPSEGDVDGDYFVKNNTYFYKISFVYDGYQEGPLSSGTFEYKEEVSREKLSVKVNLGRWSDRLSHVCLYRKDSQNDSYKLVTEVPTKSGWILDGNSRVFVITDDGSLMESYTARTGLSEILSSISLKYGISVNVAGYLFAGNCSHAQIDNASNMIFRSKPGKFSIFDWVNDFFTIESTPTALVNFGGRLYVFDNSNIYKVNPEQLIIEDKFEGIGCLSQNSVIVTDFGMFFADRNGCYMHDGTSPSKISGVIQTGGEVDTEFNGLDVIDDISWNNTGGSLTNMFPYVIYDPNSMCILYLVEFKGTITKGTTISNSRYYIWSFSIDKNRWDLWKLSDTEKIGKPFLGKDGEVYMNIGSNIYEHKGGSIKKLYTWVSKKITMKEDSSLKVFNKIKINGIESDLNLGGSNKDSSDKLLIATNTGALTTSEKVYTTKDTGHSSYKLSGSNKTGRWLQFKLENMNTPLDSIGFIFRKRPAK